MSDPKTNTAYSLIFKIQTEKGMNIERRDVGYLGIRRGRKWDMEVNMINRYENE